MKRYQDIQRRKAEKKQMDKEKQELGIGKRFSWKRLLARWLS